jgi:hypothetical protein
LTEENSFGIIKKKGRCTPMNETLQTILTRRSVRAFKPDMLPRETIDAIIEAGLGDDDIAMRRTNQAAYI